MREGAYAPHEDWQCGDAYCDEPPGQWAEPGKRDAERLDAYRGQEVWANPYDDGFIDGGLYHSDALTPWRMRAAARELWRFAEAIDRGISAGELARGGGEAAQEGR